MDGTSVISASQGGDHFFKKGPNVIPALLRPRVLLDLKRVWVEEEAGILARIDINKVEFRLPFP